MDRFVTLSLERSVYPPKTGQRVLVWRKWYGRWEFAVYDANTGYFRIENGEIYILYDVFYWLPEPPDMAATLTENAYAGIGREQVTA